MTSGSDRPYVEISPERVVCASHGEHLRAHWPQGFVVVSLKLFQAAAANPQLVNEIDPEWDGSDKTARLDEAKLNAITDRRPLCYWCTRAEIREAFMEAEFLTLGQCQVCRRSGIGGPYQVTLPTGQAQWWLCLECALDAGEREHASRPRGIRRS